MKTSKSSIFWGTIIIILVILSYVLPYTLFTDVHKWYGSFLIWGIIGILIIFANFMVTKDWRE